MNTHVKPLLAKMCSDGEFDVRYFADETRMGKRLLINDHEVEEWWKRRCENNRRVSSSGHSNLVFSPCRLTVITDCACC